MDLISELKTYKQSELFTPEEQRPFDELMVFVTTTAACFSRETTIGHVTGSAWIIDLPGESALLTYHKKLGKWLQLGGHSDGETSTREIALREAKEESGLLDLELAVDGIFDVDIHEIPAHKGEPPHRHYDVRYLIQLAQEQQLTMSSESHALEWIHWSRFLNPSAFERSVTRMAEKWMRLKGNS